MSCVSSTNINLINNPDFNSPEAIELSNRSVSKDFNFFDLLNFNNEKEYGYWLWASDMYDIDLDELSENGVKYIFLNSYAFTEYGQRDVLNWVEDANEHGIEVHVWMQIFNTGKWISPLKKGVPDTAYFNYKIEEARYYAGLEGISGIQIDYIRFEGDAYKYENSTKAINQFVKMFSEEMRKVNPDLTLSATVMPEADKDKYYYGQDIQTISKYVDFIVPMIYKGNYNQNSSWIKNTTDWYVANSDAKVWCGLQTYESDFNTSELPEAEIKKDSDLCFDGGAKGVIYFKWGMNDNIDNKKLY